MSRLSSVRRLLLLVLVVVLTGCSAGTLGDVAQSTSSVSPSMSSMSSQVPVSTNTQATTSSPVPSPTVPLSTISTPTPESVTVPLPLVLPPVAVPVRLQYPDVGIDVPIDSGIEVIDGVVDPPTLNGVYYLLNRGLPGEGSTGTTYLAGHGWQGGDPPFNALSDTFNGNRGARPGDIFALTLDGGGQLSCVVEQVLAISKDELSGNPKHEVWRKVPNRVVLFSCYIAEDDGVTRNVDVIARCGAA